MDNAAPKGAMCPKHGDMLEQIKAADDERERILKAIKEHYQDKLTTHFQNCLAHMKTLGGNVQAIIEAGLEAFRIAPHLVEDLTDEEVNRVKEEHDRLEAEWIAHQDELKQRYDTAPLYAKREELMRDYEAKVAERKELENQIEEERAERQKLLEELARVKEESVAREAEPSDN